MVFDNPAARLLSILEDGFTRKKDENCKSVWAEVLGAGNNGPLLMERLGKVMGLPSQIMEIVDREFPNQAKSQGHWIAQINNAFTQQQLAANWSSFRGHIDQNSLSFLSITSELIQAKLGTRLLESSTISDLREKVDGVLREAVGADIPGDIKRFLVRSLHKIIVAMDEYRISGAVPIQDAIDMTLGHAFVNHEYREMLRGSGIGKKVLDTLTAVASAVTVAIGLPQLPAAFKFLIGTS